MPIPPNVFTLIIDGLLWFLPEEKRRRWRRRLTLGAVSGLALIGLWIGVQWIGPTTDGPSADPIAALNRERASLESNAADVYLAAIRARSAPPIEAWRSQTQVSDKPLPPELAAWVEQNSESIELTRRAAATADCRFELKRHRTRIVDLEPAQALRRQAQFIALRARLAVDRRDPEMLADTLETLAGMRRHVSSHPGVFGDLLSLAVGSLGLQFYLTPYTWPDLTPAQRRSYERGAGRVLEPLADFGEVLEFERADFCWLVASADFDEAARYFPKRRAFAEIDRYMRPHVQLAGQAPAAQFDPQNPLWREVAELKAWPAFGPLVVFNVPRWIARDLVSFKGVVPMRVRYVAFRRGITSVAEVLRCADENGAVPESLDTLRSEHVVDPFTGRLFMYRKSAQGFTLYSAGVDRDDDGGKHDKHFGEPRRRTSYKAKPPPDGDFVFWPVPWPEDDNDRKKGKKGISPISGP